jgi:hypothetical protein
MLFDWIHENGWECVEKNVSISFPTRSPTKNYGKKEFQDKIEYKCN